MGPDTPRSAYLDALHMLSRRALTVAECRDRLLARDHPTDDVERAIEHLIETGGLNDRRLAESYARTAVELKSRGRLRIVRELQARGVDKDVAAGAIAEVFGEKDERSLIARALEKKLRGRPKPKDAADRARLYQFLMRQGFTPSAVVDALRKLGRNPSSDEVE